MHFSKIFLEGAVARRQGQSRGDSTDVRNAESVIMTVSMKSRVSSRAFRKYHLPHLVIGWKGKGVDVEGTVAIRTGLGSNKINFELSVRRGSTQVTFSKRAFGYQAQS